MRQQLVSLQHNKCAYCEDYLRGRMIEIDHIRPKKRHLYWWLAYSVENLVATCRACNNTKSSRWELCDGESELIPRQRPWVTSERTMLIDPTAEDPTLHLTYVYAGGMWRIAATSPRGRWTIEKLGLDSDSFTHEANEFVLQSMDALAQRIEAAKRARDSQGLSDALEEMQRRFDHPGQKWLHLVRTVIEHIVGGTYRPPLASYRGAG